MENEDELKRLTVLCEDQKHEPDDLKDRDTMAPYMIVGGLVPPQALLREALWGIATVAPCRSEYEFTLILRYEHDMMNDIGNIKNTINRYIVLRMFYHNPHHSTFSLGEACFKFAPKKSTTLGNCKILNPKTPALYGTLDEVNEAIALLKDPDLVRTNSELERERKKKAKASPKLLPFGWRSGTRPACLYWMCYKNPVMTRALELAWGITVGLSRLADFDTVTVRPDDDANEKFKVIAAWNDPKSGNEVFIAHVNTMGTDVNMHGCSSKGVFLNWLMNAKSMLQVIGRLIQINQENPVTFRLLKTKNSYHDNMERIYCASRTGLPAI
ncbi:hypothetical protein FIE12Z_5048 [Fusarium flagelliforme]|uniref:Uncharacterized protein n=1 Tax=Fusarium flagelliforme TaxID=2675880 RepID=A0A395MRS6_9HYPO|nr:hypothetical protein FIE12Z_5048 [Fusarium flagelliforme]